MNNNFDFTFSQPASSQVVVFLAIYTLVNTVILFPSLVLLIKRRNHRAIKYRTIYTLIPFVLFFYVMSVVESASIAFGKPQFCTSVNVIFATTLFCVTHLLLIIPSIVFQSEANNNKFNVNNTLMSRLAKHFNKLWVKMCIICTFGTLHVIIYVLVAHFTNIQGDCNRTAILVFSVDCLMFANLLSFCIGKLLFIRDPFFMRVEVTIGISINFPAMIVLSLVYGIAPQVFPSWFDYRWVYAVTSLPITLLNCVFPICLTNDKFYNWLTRLTSSKQMLSSDSDILTVSQQTAIILKSGIDIVDAVISNDILFESLKQFTIKDWSVENVMFYKEVNKFKNDFINFSSGLNIDYANRIYEQYVKNNSTSEINIDSISRHNIRQAIELGIIAIDMFDHAQEQIAVLIRTDTVGKWQQTIEYKTALAAAVNARTKSGSNSGINSNTTTTHSTKNDNGTNLTNLNKLNKSSSEFVCANTDNNSSGYNSSGSNLPMLTMGKKTNSSLDVHVSSGMV